MNTKNYSGELKCDGEVIAYYSALGDWFVRVPDVRLIGEFTNSDGPYVDDYFLVFLTAAENGWHEASFYANGRDEALASLGKSLGAPLQCGLCDSTQFKTRIMWPPQLKDQKLMEVLSTTQGSFWGKLMRWGDREIRLSAAALSVFEKRE